MKRAYLSGPMRGYPKFNFPAFDAAAEAGRSRGWDVFSPADMDREMGFDPNSADVEGISPDHMRVFARKDCDALLSLRGEEGDAIVMLPGWTKSTGAVAEFFLARWLGLVVLDATTWEPFERGSILLKHTACINKAIWQTIRNQHRGG